MDPSGESLAGCFGARYSRRVKGGHPMVENEALLIEQVVDEVARVKHGSGTGIARIAVNMSLPPWQVRKAVEEAVRLGCLTRGLSISGTTPVYRLAK